MFEKIKGYIYNNTIKVLMITGFVIVSAIVGVAMGLNSDDRIVGDLSIYKESPKPDDSILRIIQAVPRGMVESRSLKKEAFVVFNHPIVPLAVLKSSVKRGFTISPAIKGKYRWYGSRVCAFIPVKGWVPGVTYTVTVNKNLISLNKKKLKKSESFTFEYPIRELSVNSSPWKEATVDYDQTFTLSFKYDMDLKEVIRNLRVESGNRFYPFRARYQINGGKVNKRYIRVKAYKRFHRDATVNLVLASGLSSIDRAARLSEKHVITYHTHGPLTVKMDNGASYYQELWNSTLDFNNEVNRGAAKRAVRFSPYARLKDMSGKGYTKNLSLSSWDLKPGKDYTVTVYPMRDKHGNRLQEKKVFNLSVPSYRRTFRLGERNTVFEAHMKKVLPVSIASIAALDVSTEPFSLTAIQKNFDNSAVSSLFTQPKTWKTGVRKNTSRVKGYNLKKHLISGKYGWLAVRFAGSVDSWNGKRREDTETLFVQSTNLGITAKESYKETRVWVSELNSGRPVSGARVSLFDKHKKISEGVTNGEGFLILPNSKKHPLDRSIIVARKGKDKSFITRNSGGVSMYHLSSDFDEYAYKRKISGQILFDRKLYRPGDTVSFKGILTERYHGKLNPLKKKEVTLILFDSRGKKLDEKQITTTPQGGVWSSFTLDGEAPLGHYQVNFRYNSDEVNDTFQVEEFRPATFSVEMGGLRNRRAGGTARIEVTGAYLFGAPMQSAPLQYTVTRSEKKISFHRFSGFLFGNNSLWNRDSEDTSDSGTYIESTGKLNAAGKFTINLPLRSMIYRQVVNTPQKTYRLGLPYNATVESTVQDVDKKSVTKTEHFTVFPGSYLIGIKTKKRYHSVNEPFLFDLVAVNNNGTPGDEKNVSVIVLKQTWKTIMSSGPQGSVNPRNTLVTEEVHSENVVLTGEPKEFSYIPRNSGSYILLVKDTEGEVFATDGFYASGGDYCSWYYEDDDTVTLVPDKSYYKPGDTAEILIQSPFKKAQAIITVERETVLWQKSITLNGSGEPVKIPIAAKHIPNVFVSVMLIRPRVAPPEGLSGEALKTFYEEDQGRPQFKAGIVKLNVDAGSRYAKLVVKTDKKQYRPGERVVMNLYTNPGAEIALSVADRGVLDLLDYHFDNPIHKFFYNWPLGVRILELRNNIIKQFRFQQKGSNPGGQGKGYIAKGEGGFDKDSEDGTRKEFRYTAFWKPNIIADRNGKAQISFKLPHNLTTFKIMALAAAGGKYRTVEKEFKVRLPLVVQKNVPRFIRPGDSVKMGGNVVNQTGRDGYFTVTLLSKDLVPSKWERKVFIRRDQALEVLAPVTLNLKRYQKLRMAAPSQSGKGKITFAQVQGKLIVSRGGTRDAMTFTFPVIETPPEEAFTVAGFVDPPTAKKPQEYIQLPQKRAIFSKLGGMSVSVASSALVGLNNAFSFYSSNPYLCLEQRGSAFLLGMTSGKLLTSFSYKPPEKISYDFSSIKEFFLHEAADFQHSDGGFGFWKNSKRSSTYLTAYTVMVLHEASVHGYDINEKVFKNAMDYLDSWMVYPGKESLRYIYETFSMILYVKSSRKENTSGLQKLLLDHQKELSLRGRAYLAISLALEKGVNNYKENSQVEKLYTSILNNIEVTTQKVIFKEERYSSYDRVFYSDGATMGVVLRMMMMLDRHNPLIPKFIQYVIADQSKSYWSSSHSTGLLALALRDYYRLYEKGNGKVESYKASLAINNENLSSFSLKSDKLQIKRSFLLFNDLYGKLQPNKNYGMAFLSDGTKRFYYTASLKYYPRLQKVEARDEGIEIQRFLLDPEKVKNGDISGAIVKGPLKRGEMYQCRIRVVITKPGFNVVVKDPIPSNCEIVNLAFKTEKQNVGKLTTNSRSQSNADDYWWCDYVPPAIEYRDDKILIFADYMSPGMHEYNYIIRPVVKGRSAYPAGSASLMYEPEIFGRTSSGIVIVR